MSTSGSSGSECTEKDVENETISGGGYYEETCITLRG
jgi:hypothetical protein